MIYHSYRIRTDSPRTSLHLSFTLGQDTFKICDSQDLDLDFYHRVDLNLDHFGRQHCNPLSSIAGLYFSIFIYLFVCMFPSNICRCSLSRFNRLPVRLHSKYSVEAHGCPARRLILPCTLTHGHGFPRHTNLWPVPAPALTPRPLTFGRRHLDPAVAADLWLWARWANEKLFWVKSDSDEGREGRETYLRSWPSYRRA